MNSKRELKINQEIAVPEFSCSFQVLDMDLLRMKRFEHHSQRHKVVDTFSRSWFLLVASPGPNQLRIKVKSGWLELVGPTAVFAPPFGILEWDIEPGDLNWVGFAAKRYRYPSSFPREPVAFSWVRGWSIKEFEDMENLFSRPLNFTTVGRGDVDSAVALRAKEFITLNFNRSFTIRSIANRLGVSYSTMTQSFKKYYGMSPTTYRQKVRSYDAIHSMLVNGSSVTDSCYDTGFSDLSRFGQTFKKNLGANPSAFTRRILVDC